ncbi:MAG TPA: phospholipase D-like domain-containing protein [Terriglobia bacterium]|nr:phospholipase D-like domain-containing protein [Terriglobia bacterium]
MIAALVAALAYCRYSPVGSLKPVANNSAASPVISGSLRIEGPYFSDRDRIADRLIAAINQTRDSLDIAVYSITQPDIVAAIEAAHQRGVQVRVVSDEEQARDYHSEVAFLRSRGISVRLSKGFKGRRSLMHNKFAVFDGNRIETGSFNWTTSANSYNYENAIFISDPEVAARYEKEFQHLWAQAY